MKVLPLVALDEILNFNSLAIQVISYFDNTPWGTYTETEIPNMGVKTTSFQQYLKVEEDRTEIRRKPAHMEGLDVRGGNGQDYGFIVYR